MSTGVISIGRNVKGTNIPLADEVWNAFRGQVVDLLTTLGTGGGLTIYFQGTGGGVDSTTGDHEDSFTVVYGVDFGGDEDDVAHTAIALNLASIAGRFDQDSIAHTVGDTEFVSAR